MLQPSSKRISPSVRLQILQAEQNFESALALSARGGHAIVHAISRWSPKLGPFSLTLVFPAYTRLEPFVGCAISGVRSIADVGRSALVSHALQACWFNRGEYREGELVSRWQGPLC